MLKARFSSGLLLMCLSGTVSFSMSGAEMGAVITSVAKQGQQFQAQSKQFDDQKKVHTDALNQTNVAVNQQASNLNMTSPYGTGATPPTANPGYPLVDQYTNPQYWQQRGHQFKFSMDVASKRSESMNNLAKIELEQQKKKDQMMTEALGNIMNTIGSTIEQQAKDKAAQAKKDAEEAAKNELAKCASQVCLPTTSDGKYYLEGNEISQSQYDNIMNTNERINKVEEEVDNKNPWVQKTEKGEWKIEVDKGVWEIERDPQKVLAHINEKEKETIQQKKQTEKDIHETLKAKNEAAGNDKLVQHYTDKLEELEKELEVTNDLLNQVDEAQDNAPGIIP